LISGIGGSQDDSYNPKNFGYLLGTTFTRPGVITPDTDFVASLKGQREVLDNYTTTGITGQLGLTHIFTDELSFWSRFTKFIMETLSGARNPF